MTKKLLPVLLSLLFFVAAFSACGLIGTNGGATPAAEALAIGETFTLDHWELTVNDIAFVDKLPSGLMMLIPESDDMVFAYITVTITNQAEERHVMFPRILQNSRQLIAILHCDELGAIQQTQLMGYNRAALGRSNFANTTIEAPLIFQLSAAVAESEQPLRLEIRTHAGETVGMFALR